MGPARPRCSAATTYVEARPREFCIETQHSVIAGDDRTYNAQGVGGGQISATFRETRPPALSFADFFRGRAIFGSVRGAPFCGRSTEVRPSPSNREDFGIAIGVSGGASAREIGDSSGDDFASILRSLNYRMERRPKPPEPPPATAIAGNETTATGDPSATVAAAGVDGAAGATTAGTAGGGTLAVPVPVPPTPGPQPSFPNRHEFGLHVAVASDCSVEGIEHPSPLSFLHGVRCQADTQTMKPLPCSSIAVKRFLRFSRPT